MSQLPDASWMEWLWQHGPFVVGAAGGPRFSATRVFEAVIIAAITAASTFGLFVWQALPVIEAKMAAIERRLDQMEARDYEQDRRIFNHEGRLGNGK